MPVIPSERPLKTQPSVAMDPKKQMLMDILNEDQQKEKLAPPVNSPAQDEQAMTISPQEIQEAIALATIAEASNFLNRCGHFIHGRCNLLSLTLLLQHTCRCFAGNRIQFFGC